MAKAKGVIAVLTALLPLAAATGCGARAERWNVLIVVLDTIRADHLTINGYARPTSPSLDALARGGANFTQAITAAPRTWQSFTSILTGLYPPRHGVRYIFDRPLSAGTPTLGSILGKQGYETAAFDTAEFLKGMTGGVGFDTYVRPDPRRQAGTPDAILMEQVAEWIVLDRDAPFFVFVRLPGAHWPYKDGEPLDSSSSCEGRDHSFNRGTYGITRAGAGEGLDLRDEQAFRRLIWNTDFDVATLRHIISHYDGEIRHSDAIVGGLLDRLDRADLLKRTIVVVTSDHGESFGEHGYLQHGPRVDDVVMRVPLIVRLPASHPAAVPGRVVDSLVRTVDILPTVLDAVGAPLPAELDGRSLLPAIRGEPLPPLWAYGESGRSFMGVDPERRLGGVAGKQRMIRSDEWKLVFKPDSGNGRTLLFDLRKDPGERVDVSAAEPAVLAELQSHLDALLAAEKAAAPEHSLAPGEFERLRELGYVQ